MADEDLDQRVQIKGQDLEHIIDQTIDDVKNLAGKAYYTAKAAAPVGLAGLVGGAPLAIAAAISGAGFGLGKILGNWKAKAETLYKDVANEFTVGATIGIVLDTTFKGFTQLGSYIASKAGFWAGVAAKAAMGISVIPPFIELHEYTNRALISDYEAKPWEQRKEVMKEVTTYLGLPIAANFALVPPEFKIATSAAVNTTYAYMQAGKKEEPIQESVNPPSRTT
ncbi:MAG: hypothetical protein O2779_02550 [Nanoarchaeota archaeon]|nr:hypothetical protein [Nanoarchaeota archaeon]